MATSQPETLAMPLAAKLTIKGAAAMSRMRKKVRLSQTTAPLLLTGRSGFAGAVTTRSLVAWRL